MIAVNYLVKIPWRYLDAFTLDNPTVSAVLVCVVKRTDIVRYFEGEQFQYFVAHRKPVFVGFVKEREISLCVFQYRLKLGFVFLIRNVAVAV